MSKVDSIEFMKSYCDFSDSNCVWVMKGISRNKDNPNNPNMHKFFRRMVLTSLEDIESCYDDIHRNVIATNPATIYRIYISLNSRNVVTASFEFQKKLVDINHGLAKNQKDALNHAKKIGSLWKTELAQRRCRGTKRFLLDIDYLENYPDKIYNFIQQNLNTKVYCVRKTVSGWAIVFDACDTRSLMAYCKDQSFDVDLQRDSMLFIECF